MYAELLKSTLLHRISLSSTDLDYDFLRVRFHEENGIPPANQYNNYLFTFGNLKFAVSLFLIFASCSPFPSYTTPACKPSKSDSEH